MHIRSAAHRRYLWRFFSMIGLYVVVMLSVVWIFRYRPPEGVLRYVLALAPTVPVLGIIVVLGRHLAEEVDEFERRVMVEAMLWAVGATLAFGSIVDALMNFLAMGPPPMFTQFSVFLFTWGLAQPLIRGRYR